MTPQYRRFAMCVLLFAAIATGCGDKDSPTSPGSEYTIIVPGNTQWMDTGIRISAWLGINDYWYQENSGGFTVKVQVSTDS